MRWLRGSAMTGTEVARDEVRQVARQVQRGEVLQSVVADAAILAELGRPCHASGFACYRYTPNRLSMKK